MRFSYLLIIFNFVFMSCSSDHPKTWEQIKLAGFAYPSDSIVSDSLTASVKEKRLINAAYKNYAYRKHCPNLIIAEVNLNDSFVASIYQEDQLLLSKLLTYHLKQYGITHFTGQSLSDTSLFLFFYTEKLNNPNGIMQSFYIPCKSTFKQDPDWVFYQKQNR